MCGDLIAGFCDEQCAVVVEEADCADLILLRHGCDGLADELVGLVDEIVKQLVDVVRDAGRRLAAGDGGGQKMQ